MREVLDRRNRTDVKRIARVRLIGADAALAENDVRIALVHNVLRRIQPLVDRRRKSAFQHDGFACAPDRLEEAKILHIARADLEQIGIGGDRVHRLDDRHLRDDAQPRALTRLGEVLQSLFLQPLERIGRGARLVRAAADELRPALLDDLRRLEQLRTRLDRARARHHDGRPAADLHPRNVDHARCRVELTAYEFVTL